MFKKKKRFKLTKFKKYLKFELLAAGILLLISGIIIFKPGMESNIITDFENFDFNVLSNIKNISPDLTSDDTLGISDTSKPVTIKFFTKALDPRVKVLEEYFTITKSPLVEQSDIFIDKADSLGFNKWSLLAAIANVETGGCITEGQSPYRKKNCWGWRNRNGYVTFNTWQEAIETLLSKMINWNTNPYILQKSYCPPCDATGDDIWANGVVKQMEIINNIAKKYGIEKVNWKNFN